MAFSQQVFLSCSTWLPRLKMSHCLLFMGRNGGGQENEKDCKKQTDEVHSDPAGTEPQRLETKDHHTCRNKIRGMMILYVY